MLKKAGFHKKRIVYMLCFFFFCLIDQRIKTGSGLDGQIETFRGLTGVVMAVIILSAGNLNDLNKHKIPYLIWSLICVVGGILFIARGQALKYFWNERAMIAFNVWLWGGILFDVGRKTLSARGVTVSSVTKRRINLRFFCLWAVMMGIMCVSRSTYHWPALYLIMFGCFYLTDYTAEERDDLFQGMLDGIILAFWILQGWCFVFRPYDDVRYVGVYNNCNLNAIFYLVVLAAALAKLVWWQTRSEEPGVHKVAKLYYTAGVGVVLGFLFLTVSRTGWMTAALLVLLGIFFMWRVSGDRHGAQGGDKSAGWHDFRSFLLFLIKRGMIFVLCSVILFPAVFGAVRYLPPLFHHPVWFFGEWNEDKVHSWDKWDSEKYVELEDIFGMAGRRVAGVFLNTSKDSFASAKETAQKSVSVETAESNKQQPSELQMRLYEETLKAGYAFPVGYKASAIEVRKAIYRYYIHLLNFTGHPESEQGFQMTATHRIGHAHNIYLQWGVDFGVPAMILFVIIVVYTVVKLVKKVILMRSVQDAGYVMLFLVPCIFGMLEYAWGAGSITLIVLFMAWRRVICNEDR